MRSRRYRSLQCQASCTTPIPNFQSVRLCDPDAPIDECQSIGERCEPSNGLPGYSICK